MNNRPKRVILHLISLEVKRRQVYLDKLKILPSDFSNQAISQMKLILSNKDLSNSTREELEKEIETFELTTK